MRFCDPCGKPTTRYATSGGCRSCQARQAALARTPEGVRRSTAAASAASIAAVTTEQRREWGRKGAATATMTPEGRARSMAALMSAESRSAHAAAMRARRGTAASNWTGDDASYAAVHLRLARECGRARHQICADCPDWAAEWSYVGGAPDEKAEATGRDAGKPYSTDLNFYDPRCVPCHRRHDMAAA